MADYDPNAQKLRQLFESLNEDEAGAARQLLGMSLLLGSPGLAVLRHFLDSLLLFGLGRLLLLFLERIGMPAGEIGLIHECSKWYEIALFVSFAVFSLIDIFRAKFSWSRRGQVEPL